MLAGRRTHPPTRSLATIVRGELLEIRCIIFDGVRAVCERAGLQLGDHVRCRDVTPTRLLLETDEGKVTWLDRRWAHFVEAAEARRLPPQVTLA